LWILLVIVFVAHAAAEDTREITCTGTIVDVKGTPIEGARASFYHVTYDYTAYTAESKLTGEITTSGDGVFSFKAAPESDSNQRGYVVARKEGFVLGWVQWEMQDDQQQNIILSEPMELSGTVVDEGGKPLPDANVGVWMIALGEGPDQQSLGRPVAEELLTVATDSSGRFTFTNIPAEATADFIIRKSGKTTINTYRSTGYANQKMTFAPGQSGIKLVLSDESRIQGTIVVKDTGNPVTGTKLMVTTQGNQPLFGQEAVVSKDDGTFSIDALAAGNYLVQLVRPRQGTADWAAEPAVVSLETGQTKKDIKIELCKGGILEVLVTEADTGKPVDKASVSIRDEKYSRWLSTRSGEDGIARIRLMPGGYQLSGAYRQGYMSDQNQEAVTIKEGQSKRATCKLNEMPKIEGVVRDPAGMPLEGVQLMIMPGGREQVKSDSQGNFEIIWDKRYWGSREGTVFCLVARHKQRNLATALQIGDDTKTLDLKLSPGVTFTGRIVNPEGKGIAGAIVRMNLQLSNWGSSFGREQSKSDADGNYRIQTIPAGHNYSIIAVAEGYGEMDIRAHTDNAQDNQLNIETITLPIANLAISGRVVDTGGNRVPDVRISGSGDKQPRSDTLSDKQGNFILEGLCEGVIYIRADINRDGKQLSARVHTDAGASGIEIVVREGQSASYYIRAKTYEQVVGGADKFISGVALDEKGLPVAGVPVGVCCIKRPREEGKFSWTYSSYSTLSDITDEQGRFAIELEEDAQYNLLFSPVKQAAIIIYDIPAGKKDLKVTLPEGGTVSGRLLRMENGKKVPVPNAEVKIQQTDRTSYTHLGFDRDQTTITDSEGRFRFEHISTKVRPDGSRSDQKWEYVPRVWEILYGDTAKTVAFYDGTAIEDFELIVKPSLTDAGSLTGGDLPGFDGIKIDLSADQIKDKAMLICFFDMNQRPSRNAIIQLARQAEELKQKDVAVIAIQASTVAEDTLTKWIKDQNISFPVGMIRGDEDEMRFTWCVKSLPWLILTDQKHIVREEGFAMAELDEKLKASK